VEVIGREAELAAVAAFLDAIPEGAHALLFEGEAGIGKTTIWEAGLDAALERSYRVLSCRASGAETQLPFTGLGDLLSDVPEQVLASLPIPQRRAVDVALLRADAEGSVPDWRAVSMGVLGVLRSDASTRPLVIAIDDAQWLDLPTARVLAFCLRRIRTEPVGIYATVRGHADAAPVLELDHALDHERIHRSEIAPLGAIDLGRIVESRLGGTLRRATLHELARVSGGNPFYALEIARALLRPGVEVVPGRSLPIPSRLLDLVRERLARLPAPARDVLAVASALSQPTVAVIRAAVSLPEQAKVGLSRAIEAGVIEVMGEDVRFTHPLLASCVYSDLPPDRRRKLHSRLAAVVADPEARARHLALGTAPPDPIVAASLEEAARRANARGAPDAAAELAGLALRFTRDEDDLDLHRRRLDAARFHILGRSLQQANRVLEEAIAQSSPGPRRAEALVLLAGIRMEDSMPLAGELARQALEEAGEEASLRAEACNRLAWVQLMMGDTEGAGSTARRSLEMAEADGDPARVALALHAVINTETQAGKGISEDLVRRLQNIDITWGDELPSFVPGMVLIVQDRLEEARSYLRDLHRSYAERGAPRGACEALARLSEVEYRAGNFREAANLAWQAHELVRDEGRWFAGGALVRIFEASAILGRVEEARGLADQAAASADAIGSRRFFPRIWAALGSLELSLGNVASAHDELGRAVESAYSQGTRDPAFVPFVPNEVEALVALGRLEEAKSLLGDFEERANALGRTSALAAAARSQGLLLSALGDPPGALAALERALGYHDRIPDQVFEFAHTLLVMGEIQRRARKRRAARASLWRAKEIFERCGAPLWSKRADEELRRIGGRPPAPLDLTPTEQRVAELVAAGRSNQQVAAALFMSRNTVADNLKRIYRKLNVESRTELAARYASRSSQP
jgi:DNA-binding CsgD family transcriptional regulator